MSAVGITMNTSQVAAAESIAPAVSAVKVSKWIDDRPILQEKK